MPSTGGNTTTGRFLRFGSSSTFLMMAFPEAPGGVATAGARLEGAGDETGAEERTTGVTGITTAGAGTWASEGFLSVSDAGAGTAAEALIGRTDLTGVGVTGWLFSAELPPGTNSGTLTTAGVWGIAKTGAVFFSWAGSVGTCNVGTGVFSFSGSVDTCFFPIFGGGGGTKAASCLGGTGAGRDTSTP